MPATFFSLLASTINFIVTNICTATSTDRMQIREISLIFVAFIFDKESVSYESAIFYENF